MRKLILGALLLLSTLSFGQNYKINRMTIDNFSFNIKGSLKITKDTITIVLKNETIKIPVTTMDMVYFKPSQQNENNDVRMKLTSINNSHFFTYENIDTFTKKLTTILYMIKKED